MAVQEAVVSKLRPAAVLNNVNELVLGAKEHNWVVSHLTVQYPIECPCSLACAVTELCCGEPFVTIFSAPHKGSPFYLVLFGP